MRKWPSLLFLPAGLVVFAGAAVAQDAPPANGVLLARPALAFNPIRRCPDLRVSDDGDVVVVFKVNRAGGPSQLSIKTSSHSAELNAAALECVGKLRFQPATRIGDGEPIDSWQEIGWVWSRHAPANEAARAGKAAPPAEVESAPGDAAQNRAGASGRPPGDAKGHKVSVHVCADQSGQLTGDPTVVHSSGDSQLDAAAVQIAKSGAPYYRSSAHDGRSSSGCARMTIEFDTP